MKTLLTEPIADQFNPIDRQDHIASATAGKIETPIIPSGIIETVQAF